MILAEPSTSKNTFVDPQPSLSLPDCQKRLCHTHHSQDTPQFSTRDVTLALSVVGVQPFHEVRQGAGVGLFGYYLVDGEDLIKGILFVTYI